jgi:hypothetical protein
LGKPVVTAHQAMLLACAEISRVQHNAPAARPVIAGLTERSPSADSRTFEHAVRDRLHLSSLRATAWLECRLEFGKIVVVFPFGYGVMVAPPLALLNIDECAIKFLAEHYPAERIGSKRFDSLEQRPR